MALMHHCSADLSFRVCGFESWVVPDGRFKAAEFQICATRSSGGPSQKRFSFCRS